MFLRGTVIYGAQYCSICMGTCNIYGLDRAVWNKR